jgi:hypothetical protein
MDAISLFVSLTGLLPFAGAALTATANATAPSTAIAFIHFMTASLVAHRNELTGRLPV